MKKFRTVALFSLATLAFGSLAQAGGYGYRGHHYGGYRHGGGYGDGFVGGILASTASLFALSLTHETVHHKELVYIGAADEAAEFLQKNGGEPSALLREALETERNFLIEAKVEGAETFADEILAELVVGRAASLSS